MDKPKVLPGDVLVAKGVTKQGINLPEVGYKDVAPNGSWLERKQIQTALELRKQMLEVERIEKIGNISQAIWRDDLQQAEVTYKCGGCWNYFGYNVGKSLYLRPEEVLFLMEVNSLQLKHNDVVVSIQKAFSLVLNSSLTYNQYKVYASLSRLGYRVFKHDQPLNGPEINPMTASKTLDKQPKEMDAENVLEEKLSGSSQEVLSSSTNDMQPNIHKPLPTTKPNNSTDIQENRENERIELDCENNKTVDIQESPCDMEVNETDTHEIMYVGESMQCTTQGLESEDIKTNVCEGIVPLNDIPLPPRRESQEESIRKHESVKNANKDCCQAAADSTVQSNRNFENENIHTAGSHKALASGRSKSREQTYDNTKTESGENNKSICFSDALISKRHEIFQNYETKLKILTGRRYKPSNFISLDKYFENVPALCGKESVVIHAPKQEHIPQNIYVYKTSYVLKLKNIRRKRTESDDRLTNNNSDEANVNRIRRLRSISNSSQNWPRPNQYHRPNIFWRHPNNLNYVQFDMVFQRPLFSDVYFHSLQYQPRPNFSPRHYSYNSSNNAFLTSNENNNAQKRVRDDKSTHLSNILNLSRRLKHFVMKGKNQRQNVEALHRLLYAYNVRYKTCLRLTKEYDVINDEDIIETIDLGDDEIINKMPKLNQDMDENFNSLRKLAKKLKDLNAKKKTSSRHKRALSRAIKIFNKSYNADVYMNANFEVIDRQFINIDSDSDSDCVITRSDEVYKGKKLRNPFNILKRRSEQLGEPKASTSKEAMKAENFINNFATTEGTSQRQHLVNIFNGNWLPNLDDFGRPEVVVKYVTNSLFLDVFKEDFLLNYVNSNVRRYNNWLEGKIDFLQHMKETDIACQNEHKQQISAIKESITQCELKPLLDSEDCSEPAFHLEKLRIIKSYKKVVPETKLTVDFDAYCKEITNFKKKKPPKPHFRIIVFEESSIFPSSEDFVSISSKFEDSVPIMFAIVGFSSISYVQFSPIDTPVYVTSKDLY